MDIRRYLRWNTIHLSDEFDEFSSGWSWSPINLNSSLLTHFARLWHVSIHSGKTIFMFHFLAASYLGPLGWTATRWVVSLGSSTPEYFPSWPRISFWSFFLLSCSPVIVMHKPEKAPSRYCVNGNLWNLVKSTWNRGEGLPAFLSNNLWSRKLSQWGSSSQQLPRIYVLVNFSNYMKM